MRKDAPIYSQVKRFRLDGRYQIGRDAGRLDILFANASPQLLIADTCFSSRRLKLHVKAKQL